MKITYQYHKDTNGIRFLKNTAKIATQKFQEIPQVLKSKQLLNSETPTEKLN